ncbi:hypothetical protein FE374_12470 [Georgenia yuyongxinii]|uniref:HTH luxR-type domain-containing protein n=1 Tax=Georgenia yuyongxinii TaxID=2589797 RepID=A0A5B8C3J6_9MICO|nr:LuxR C-terminal-related transcriptional regulator [Georgenia yuyongxinii]QDC25319.1 hypothetical protein FE374_12470 [Georgenia yuyongxinii]
MSLLDEVVLERPVTLLAAPVGFGKTSTLAQWCGHTESTVGWMTVDEFDSDPDRFFRHIVSALQVALHVRGRSDAGLLLDIVARDVIGPWPQAAGWPDHYDELVLALEELEHPLVLVLDDLHLLTGSEAMDILARLMRLTPAVFHLLLSSRSDPELPLNRLRLAGDLGEVRERDLAFSGSEIEALAKLAGLSLSAEDAESLHAITGGWPAAVRMGLLTLQHEPAPDFRLAGMQGIDLPLTEYLTEEVLASLRPDLAQFIMRATIGDRIDAGLADELHGGPGGAELLAEAVRRGVFLTPESDGVGDLTYRWHPVFASQCRLIMRRETLHAAHELQHTAAGYWRTRDGFEAIGAALAGNEPQLAADILTERWPEILLRNDARALLDLCDRIAAPFADDAEILRLRAVGEFLEGQPSSHTVTQARAAAKALPPERRRRFDLVDTLVSVFLAPDRPGPEEAIRRGRAALGDGDDVPVARALGHLLVGETMAQLQRDPVGALSHLRRGEALAIEHRLPAMAFACQSASSVPLFQCGHFAEAHSLAREAIGRARRGGRHWASLVVPAYLTCGLADYWRDDLGAATRSLDQVVRLAPARQAGYRLHAVLILTLIAVASDDAAALERAQTLAREQAGTPSTYLAGFVRMVDAVSADARGDQEQALALVRDFGTSEQHPLVRLWEAETYRRAGDAPHARAALAGIPASRRISHLQVGALLTETLLKLGDVDAAEAHRSLETALEAASPALIRRPFIERALDLRGLLYDHHAWGTQYVALVADLLARMQDHGNGHRNRSYWDLTDRELVVLAYLRSPMTTIEIAEALFVSSNTVKTHMRSIYRKLGATGRRDAVRIAVERHTI